MSNTKQWLGIDVSQSYLDIAIYPLNTSFRVANNESGRLQLVERISGVEIEGIVLEATGGLERNVMAQLELAGYPTRRVNPAQVRHFALICREAGQN
jgi:transposase